MPAQTTPEPFTVTEPDQNRNTLVYAAIIAMVYLTAPTLYVGAVQATLCKRLETSDTLANVPSTVYLAMAWFPVVVAWLFPQARHLKRAMTLGLVALAMMCGTVALVLATDAPRGAIIGILIAHAAVAGGANTVVQIHAWEALRRGVSEKRRGRALAFAFGGGAAVAVVGSLWAQLLLDNELFGWQPPQLFQFAYPYNYVALFSGSSATEL
jgi:MFS family permease